MPKARKSDLASGATLRLSSYGVGELIRAALDLGATRLLIGCGDSGVNDGGAGSRRHSASACLIGERGRSVAVGRTERARAD
jgi:glycerate 2-kinase